MGTHAGNIIKSLILDMDGVIWKDSTPIGNLPSIFNKIKEQEYKVALATNNATLSINQYINKLASFGVELEEWQIINSALATSEYLHSQFPGGGPVYIIGEIGLINTLKEYGFYESNQNVVAVVVAMDRHLNYDKLKQATLLIRSGTPFIGTNPDRTFPTPEGIVPGAGSILAALEASCEKKPLVIGKPRPDMYRYALERLGSRPNETLVVGDRLETDIAGAQALGCRTGVVLSGVSTETEARQWKPAPDFIANDLTELLNIL
jgi:4-nitrophenyl phosphatase